MTPEKLTEAQAHGLGVALVRHDLRGDFEAAALLIGGLEHLHLGQLALSLAQTLVQEARDLDIDAAALEELQLRLAGAL